MLSAPVGQRLGALLLHDHQASLPARRYPWIFLATILAALLTALHAAPSSGSLRSQADRPTGIGQPILVESKMHSKSLAILAASVAFLPVGSAARAQSAVEWRTVDGGNGHWYATVDAPTGDAAIDLASSMGAHLATISGVAENNFIKSMYLATGRQWAWLGLRQSTGQTTPDAGWHWITGEPYSYLNWSTHDGAFPTGAPDDSPCALPPWGVENDQANQGVMQFDGRWDDLETGAPTCGSPTWSNAAILEWDADCNGDGIVDYGQIVRGEFADLNGNHIPDCCDDGIPCGPNLILNGSFETGRAQVCGWICVPVGGTEITDWRVTLNTVDRQRTAPPNCQPEGWIASDGEYSIDLNGCSVGGRIEQTIATEPGRRYAVAVQLTVNAGVARGELRIHAGLQTFDFAADRIKAPIQPWSRKTIEFTAASASTTIAFESLNREYPAQWAGPVIDDVRVVALPQAPCPGDVTGDRRIDGVDLAAVLGAWGTAGSGQFDTDVNDDGAVDGVDLATILGGWGACP